MFVKKLKRALVAAVAGCMVLGSTFTSLAAGEAYKIKDLFVADTYLEEYVDLQEAIGDNDKALLSHYLTYGVAEGRESSLTDLIDLKKYREANPDLDAAFGDNWDAYLNHYLTFGINEGRPSYGTFDATFYAERYPDLMAAFGNDVFQLYRHYLQFGANEGRWSSAPTWLYASSSSCGSSGGSSSAPVYEEVAVSGNIVDPETGRPISGVEVIAERISESTGLTRTIATATDGDATVSGGNGTVSGGNGAEIAPGVYRAYTDANGNYVFPTLLPGTYTIRVNAEGYMELVFATVEVTGQEQASVVEQATLLSDSGNSGVFGVVESAVTGEVLEGVTVTFFAGWNASGDVVGTATTDENGFYSVDLPRGYYTARFAISGYITAVENVIACGITQDADLSPSDLNEGEYRIVLTWGETPRDLDSYLYGQTETSDEMFHVWYGDKEHVENGERVAWLDLDDTTSFGPETVTVVREVAPGSVYRYSVRDFSNRGNDESYAMSNSGAQVNIYKGAVLLRTINIPANVPGYIWNVFEINGDGVVTTINAINSDDSTMELQSAE